MNTITEATIDSYLAKMIEEQTDWIWEYDVNSDTDKLMAFSSLAEMSGASWLASQLKKELNKIEEDTISTSPDKSNSWWMKANEEGESIVCEDQDQVLQ